MYDLFRRKRWLATDDKCFQDHTPGTRGVQRQSAHCVDQNPGISRLIPVLQEKGSFKSGFLFMPQQSHIHFFPVGNCSDPVQGKQDQPIQESRIQLEHTG